MAIPATLQEALLAGWTVCRAGNSATQGDVGARVSELHRAVAPVNEINLQTALSKLAEAEFFTSAVWSTDPLLLQTFDPGPAYQSNYLGESSNNTINRLLGC